MSKQKCLSGRKFRNKGKRILRFDRKFLQHATGLILDFWAKTPLQTFLLGLQKPVPNKRCGFSPAMLFELICLGAEDVNWEVQSQDAADEAAGTSAETENEQDSSGEFVNIFNLILIKLNPSTSSPVHLN